MRFMIMVLATKEADEAGRLPTGEELAEMGKYQEEMVKAGVLLAGEGLRPTSLGARVKFVGGGKRPQATDGPFAESKELIAGFSIIQVRSKAEAIEWASRAPFPEGTQLEIRQVFEDDDFAPSDPTGELRTQDEKRRQKYARKARLAFLALSIATTDAFAQTTAASPSPDYGNPQAWLCRPDQRSDRHVGQPDAAFASRVALSSLNLTVYGFLEARVDFDRSRSTC